MKKPETLLCKYCNETKPFDKEHFRIAKNAKFGLGHKCRKCSQAQYRKWYGGEKTARRSFSTNEKDGTRLCGRCNEWKILNLFPQDRYEKRYHKRYICRACTQKVGKEFYKNLTYERLSEYRYYKEKTKRDRQIWICQYLEKHSCVDCGNSDIRNLEFDHLDETTKYRDISSLVCTAASMNTIIEEIEKCEVVCANCHRIRTACRGNHYKHLYYRGQLVSMKDKESVVAGGVSSLS